MKPDSIHEELWKIKEDLAREAGYDVHRFFENLRHWSASHLQAEPMIDNAEQLRHLAAKSEQEQSASVDLILKEEPPHNS